MLSVHLSVAASMAGRKTCILDLDPQGSATAWKKPRLSPLPAVAHVPTVALDRAIAGAVADGFDFIIIDSPPSVSASAAKIIAAADLVIVPIRPEPLDLAALPDTLKLIGTKRLIFVLSDCPQRAPEVKVTGDMLSELGYPVLGPVYNWRAMSRSLVSGQAISEFKPDSKPAREIQGVCADILYLVELGNE